MAKWDVMIVDDDRDLAMITKDMLEDKGYSVAYLSSAEEAYVFMEKNQPSLLVLDINLPGDSGFDFCRELRNNSTVPVIFVSARTSETDRVKGLDLGADDYLPKPFSLLELESRIRANLRRTYGFQKKRQLSFGNVMIDTANRQVSKDGKKINLSVKEYDLLYFLVTHPGEVFSKDTLLSEIWGAFREVEVSTIAVHMRWLREKCEDNPSKPVYLKTVWGVGYEFAKEDLHEDEERI